MRSAWMLLRRIVVAIVGVAILVVGAVLLVAPGPGLLVVALGLFVLGTEFAWARRWFGHTRHHAQLLADRAAANRWSTVGSALFGLAVLAAGVVCAATRLLPVGGVATGASLCFAGVVLLGTLGYSVVRRHRPPARRDLGADSSRALLVDDNVR